MKKRNLVLAICMASATTAYAQSEVEIEEILIYGQQLDSESETGSRLGLTLIETPATVEIIDGEIIRSRIDTTVLEAVTRSAGITDEANPGNGGTSVAARGFRGQGAVTKLYDGTNYYTAFGTVTFPFDVWGVERIEVLKGPASVIYGEGGIGGAINVIPKSPSYEADRDIRLTLGQDSEVGLGIGLGGALAENVAYRLDISHQESDGWVERGESDSQMISGAIQWDASEALTLTARFDYGDQSPSTYFGSPLVDGDFVDELVGRNFNPVDGEISYEDQSFRLKADWTIDEDASLSVEAFRLDSDRFWNNAEGYTFDPINDEVTITDVFIIGHDMEQQGIRLNFLNSDEIGGISVRSSFGAEFNQVDFARPSNFGSGNANGLDGNDSFTTDVNNRSVVLADVHDSDFVDDGFAKLNQRAVFAEVQVQATESLSLVGALRSESVNTTAGNLNLAGDLNTLDQNVDFTTGRIGFVYDITDIAVVYGQYSQGATHPSNTLVSIRSQNRELDPIRTEQFEIGIKQAGLDGRLQWSLAYFDITRNDILEDDPNSNNPTDVVFIPEQTSNGFELGFNLNFGNRISTYGNAVILNAETNTGDTPTLIPERTLNLGVAVAAVDRANLYVDLQYVGERVNGANPTVPSFTVVDASVAYELNDATLLTLKVDNLFDRLYASTAYTGSQWLVAQPRTLSLTADYSF